MKRFLPVLHVKDETQALVNTEMVVNSGAHGIFLIHHGAGFKELFRVAEIVNKAYPSLWIGVNPLDLNPEQAYELAPEFVKGLWSDNAGVEEFYGKIDASIAKKILYHVSARKTPLEYFGGFAFKYQSPVYNLEEGAATAALYMNVVTTSGDGTGIAADIKKVERIFNGCKGNARIGIASGITPENVRSYLPYVDDFLVATGISKNFYNFDSDRLNNLSQQILNYDNE